MRNENRYSDLSFHPKSHEEKESATWKFLEEKAAGNPDLLAAIKRLREHPRLAAAGSSLMAAIALFCAGFVGVHRMNEGIEEMRKDFIASSRVESPDALPDQEVVVAIKAAMKEFYPNEESKRFDFMRNHFADIMRANDVTAEGVRQRIKELIEKEGNE